MTWQDIIKRMPKDDLTFLEIMDIVNNQGFHAIEDMAMQKEVRDNILEDIDLYGEAFTDMLKNYLAKIAKRD